MEWRGGNHMSNLLHLHNARREGRRLVRPPLPARFRHYAAINNLLVRHRDDELRLTRSQEESGQVVGAMAFGLVILAPSCATGYAIVELIARVTGAL